MIISTREMAACLSGETGDPHSLLGLLPLGSEKGMVGRCLSPDADQVELVDLRTNDSHPMERLDANGFFELHLPLEKGPFPYRFLSCRGKEQWEWEDPYRFSPVGGNKEL